MKRTDADTLKELQSMNANSDRLWDRVYQSVMAGKIELEYIVSAIDQCNRTDDALMSYEWEQIERQRAIEEWEASKNGKIQSL